MNTAQILLEDYAVSVHEKRLMYFTEIINGLGASSGIIFGIYAAITSGLGAAGAGAGVVIPAVMMPWVALGLVISSVAIGVIYCEWSAHELLNAANDLNKDLAILFNQRKRLIAEHTRLQKLLSNKPHLISGHQVHSANCSQDVKKGIANFMGLGGGILGGVQAVAMVIMAGFAALAIANPFVGWGILIGSIILGVACTVATYSYSHKNSQRAALKEDLQEENEQLTVEIEKDRQELKKLTKLKNIAGSFPQNENHLTKEANTSLVVNQYRNYLFNQNKPLENIGMHNQLKRSQSETTLNTLTKKFRT